MIIQQFINDKITQLSSYIKAVANKKLHYIELDMFIDNVMEEWAYLEIHDETPSSSRERVFWHLIHEISLQGAQALQNDLFFKSEIFTCLDFFYGIGSYPIDCIGWRPLP